MYFSVLRVSINVIYLQHISDLVSQFSLTNLCADVGKENLRMHFILQDDIYNLTPAQIQGMS